MSANFNKVIVHLSFKNLTLLKFTRLLLPISYLTNMNKKLRSFNKNIYLVI